MRQLLAATATLTAALLALSSLSTHRASLRCTQPPSQLTRVCLWLAPCAADVLYHVQFTPQGSQACQAPLVDGEVTSQAHCMAGRPASSSLSLTLQICR